MSAPHRLAIALLAKGAVNNLHGPDVVEAFRARGIDVRFLVAEAYLPVLERLPGCRYLTCRFAPEDGSLAYRRELCRYVRSLYANRRIGLLTRAEKTGTRRRLTYGVVRLLARFRAVQARLLRLEARLYRNAGVLLLDPGDFDQLLLQTLGGRDADGEARLAWWARQRGRSVIHMVGNYDHLSSKGYRGAPVDHLLVWGPVMRDDAIRLHGLPPDRVRMIGPIRYDRLAQEIVQDRSTFLARLGLDPAKRTVLFAGAQAEYHYFEMLQVLAELQRDDGGYQLILRIYPDRALMASPYMTPLIRYAQTVPGVYVSIGDPHGKAGGEGAGAPRIEQDELWHALRHSDVVVNLYSTIALEACLFDKPAVYVGYYPTRGYAWLRPPLYFDYGQLLHNRRMTGYGAVPLARDRRELIHAIRDAVLHPERRRQERAEAVRREFGPIDGQVAARLAQACVDALGEDAPRHPGRTGERGAGHDAGRGTVRVSGSLG